MPVKRFEYLHDIWESSDAWHLNALGEEGWELVSVSFYEERKECPDFGSYIASMCQGIFKRERSNKD